MERCCIQQHNMDLLEFLPQPHPSCKSLPNIYLQNSWIQLSLQVQIIKSDQVTLISRKHHFTEILEPITMKTTEEWERLQNYLSF